MRASVGGTPAAASACAALCSRGRRTMRNGLTRRLMNCERRSQAQPRAAQAEALHERTTLRIEAQRSAPAGHYDVELAYLARGERFRQRHRPRLLDATQARDQ